MAVRIFVPKTLIKQRIIQFFLPVGSKQSNKSFSSLTRARCTVHKHQRKHLHITLNLQTACLSANLQLLVTLGNIKYLMLEY